METNFAFSAFSNRVLRHHIDLCYYYLFYLFLFIRLLMVPYQSTLTVRQIVLSKYNIVIKTLQSVQNKTNFTALAVQMCRGHPILVYFL